MHSFLAGGVCGECNGGWMSSLEVSTMEVLKSLISAEIDIESVSQDKMKNIAKWAYKTATVLNSTTNYFKMVPPEHYGML